MYFRASLFLFLLLALTSCAQVAIMAAPKKMKSVARTSAAIAAEEFFWTNFHAGNFQRLDEIFAKLKNAYAEDPRDIVTAALIGYAHAWRASERSRFVHMPSSIIDDAELARFYFAEAHKLYGNDARILGHLASATLASGTFHQDQKKIREGYFLGLDAIRLWPEFNLPTIGVFMSGLDKDSDYFKEGLAWQYQALDLCSETKIDRKNPDFAPYMKDERDEQKIRKKSACWNSWRAPHNFEGFMLNMGDMLMKNGDVNEAIIVYSNARLSRSYDAWPYRPMLEQRLLLAGDRKAGKLSQHVPKPMMAESSFSCMACHQAQ